MNEAVIVATARTAIGKANRGAFNRTAGAELVAPLVRTVLDRASIPAELVEEVVMGCGFPEGATGGNIARVSALRAGLPVSSSAVTVSRYCASGLEAIAHAARAIRSDGVSVAIAGGVESISMVQPHVNRNHLRNAWLQQHKPGLYSTMIATADLVAERYGVSRAAQDEFAFESQQRTAQAQQRNLFDAEIVPLRVLKDVTDKETGATTTEEVTLSRDEGNRPETTLEALAKLKPVTEGQYVTAGNASQLSDGASVSLLMSADEAEKRGVPVLGKFLGFAAAGCEPEEMGIGPVFAIPRLLKRFGLAVNDIDIWELNEAFASQAIYCRDQLGIPSDRLNVNGGAISIGHPYGMSGARMVGHVLLEGRRRGARYGVVSMCVSGGQGCAGLIEIAG